MLLTKPEVERPHSVAYLCKEHGEGNTCPRDGSTCSYDMCKHATDVKYAKNFVQVSDDNYMEIDDDQRRWIPCSERLPKRDELVLVSYRGEVCSCKYLDDGSENAWWCYIYDHCIWNNDIAAWMPLPEPYKKEGENNET